MAKKQGNRIVITMACTECRERNYSSMKNRRNDTQRMELNKFCPRCHGRRLHREVR
ncbi:MAG: 50S ribosomal protein L33 [Dehalococcoidia bacterium]|nr:50S ribosomal protein L33 [Dehalococcoidia bacterium]